MRLAKKVLLIGWDAADWKIIHPLMDAGKMPNVQRLVEGGVLGHIATLHPPLSPMLWTSIATGKRPFKHGIHGFTEPTPDGLFVQPVTNLSRRCKAVWNILNQSGLRSVVVGWWPSHPAEPLNGVTVSDHYHRAHGPLARGWPLPVHTVHPAALQETLAELRLHPDELVPALIEPFIPKAREIDQDRDKRLACCMRTFCECVSIHSAATYLMEHEPWDFFAVYYDAIDHFCHGFMRYHPPRQASVSAEDFALYSGVVAMAYQFHDQMLGTLLAKAGADTTVILLSDHGFHSDHLRPDVIPHIPAGPAIEHRDFGILALGGPGFKRDGLLHGPSILDIAPTILTLFGLPVGQDMDGKVLVDAFEQPPAVQAVASWEQVPGDDGRHPPHTRLDPVAAQQMLEQLVALGYIARPDEVRERAVAEALVEQQYNLAQAYQDADRHGEALTILRGLHEADPDEQRFAVQRFVSCQALGRLDDMRAIVADLDTRRRELYEQALTRLQELRRIARERLRDRRAEAGAAEGMPAVPAPGAATDSIEEAEQPLLNADERRELARWQRMARFNPPVVDYLQAQVHAMEDRPAEALELLSRVQQADLARPGLYLQTAHLYFRLRRYEEAESTYARALAVDPDNPHAHVGLSRLALRRRDYTQSAQSALDALRRLYHYPIAHFLLGVSLIGMRQLPRAAEALRTALRLNPHFPEAHLQLARVLRRLGERQAAAEHIQLFQELKHASASPPVEVDRTAETPESEMTASTPATADAPVPAHNDSVVIVTGLPRSGTSMVMQMLAAGGLPVLSDQDRAADEDNPLGYFEYEPVKHLHEQNGWVKDARGRAVKVVAPLLHHLPADQDFAVVFIDRDVDEVLASQRQMLLRRGAAPAEEPARQQRLRDGYRRQVVRLRAALPRWPRTRTLFLRHAEVLADSHAAAEALNRFLGGRLNTGAMAAQVKQALHRQRAAAIGAQDSR